MYTEADRKIAELSLTQHNVFVVAQAIEAGLTMAQVKRRLDVGAWQRLAGGVYALAGVAVTPRGRLHAATLAISWAVASHESAGELRDYPFVPRGLVVVSVPHAFPNRSRLARVRRVVDYDPFEHTVIDGIPVTSALRTAGDLAAALRADRYQQMIDQLLVDKVITSEALADYAVQWCRRGRKGSALLWQTVDARGAGYVAPESVLEAKGFEVLAEGGFPAPVRQLALPWRDDLPGRIDCGYPDERVLIEFDGRKYHMIEAQFETDRRRDDEAVAHGWAPLRFTWKMLHHEVDWVWDMTRGALRHGTRLST